MLVLVVLSLSCLVFVPLYVVAVVGVGRTGHWDIIKALALIALCVFSALLVL